MTIEIITLPDFDGKPVLASCLNCNWLSDASDGPEYSNYPWYVCEKTGREFVSNLKTFPFKTGQSCCELSIAFTLDWEAEAKKEINDEIGDACE